MFIDSKANLGESECRDECREICKGCCWYKATPLCPEWEDCPDCTKIKQRPCVYIYHDLQAEGGKASSCAACCDCTDDEGCESCGCGCWYKYNDELRCSARWIEPGGIIPCCSESCGTGKPCTPLAGGRCWACLYDGFPDSCYDPDCLPDIPGGPSSCRSIRPVYKWRGECWTLNRSAFSNQGAPLPDDTDLPCSTVTSAQLCNHPFFTPDYFSCAEPQECDDQFCECCDSCDPEIISWCEWGATLVTPDYYCPGGGFGGGFGFCQDDFVDSQCGDCDACCGDPPEPPNCPDNCVNDCPPGQRCCPPKSSDSSCFCRDENKDCEPDGVCNIDHPCCSASSTQSHSLNVTILVNAKFELGGTGGVCSGGCEGAYGEAFGSQSLNVTVGPGEGNQGDIDQYDVICGGDNTDTGQNNRIICAAQDSCGLMPAAPGSSPKFTPDINTIPNCDVIDTSCCPQQSPAYITDFIECGSLSGTNIPHPNHQANCLQSTPFGCPKGLTRFGNRHLGLQMATSFSVRCDGLYGGGFSVGEEGTFPCPRLELGHWCGGPTSYGCPAPGSVGCGFNGQPQNFNPDSWSIGTTGSIDIPGYFSGYVDFSGGQNCLGNARMSVTFQPADSSTYNAITFSSSTSSSDHPCAGSGSAYQWFDWDYQISNLGTGLAGDYGLAGRIRENCGVQPPSYFDPDSSALVTEIKSRHAATGQTSFAALELVSAIDILQLSFANRGATADAPPTGYGRNYRTQGFSGCDLGRARHNCNNCQGTVVDLYKASWSRGNVQAYGRMTYS